MINSLRTRDIAIFFLLIQLAAHLIIHWKSYYCEMYGNITACSFIIVIVIRQIISEQKQLMLKFFVFLLLIGLTISLTYIIANQNKEECVQKTTFIFYIFIGYVLTISSAIKQMNNYQNKARIPQIIDSQTL